MYLFKVSTYFFLLSHNVFEVKWCIKLRLCQSFKFLYSFIYLGTFGRDLRHKLKRNVLAFWFRSLPTATLTRMIGRYLTFLCLPQVQKISRAYNIYCINKQNGKFLFYEPEIPRPPLGWLGIQCCAKIWVRRTPTN
jgi:hypothetical protein